MSAHKSADETRAVDRQRSKVGNVRHEQPMLRREGMAFGGIICNPSPSGNETGAGRAISDLRGRFRSPIG